ncbi:MAG: hypothetical protein PUG90_01605 [Clostridia bacterium]|nr:hypothetical protein [Clostridia bacterium]MDY4082883.1 hypothetical protein [Eubacteriales bacterium]
MKKSMLLSTIAMIVVVVVALSTATFAWFSSTQSATISGTTTITATKEFTVRTWQTNAWADTDTIQLNATTVTALAPMGTGLGMVTEGDTVDDNVNISPALAWFTTDKSYTTGAKSKSKAYTTAALANKGIDGGSMANVSSFQLAPVAAAGATAAFDIKLDIAGVTADDLKTLNAINVVLEISSYDNTNAAEYYGTTYKVGDNGVEAGSPTDGVAEVTTIGEAAKKGTAGAPATNLKADAVTSLTGGTITAITDPATQIVARQDGYYKTDSNLYKVITASRALGAGEYVLVNVYVWLDGYDAVDAMMAKAVNVSIAISKA